LDLRGGRRGREEEAGKRRRSGRSGREKSEELG
jgi:hypothetical protein